MTDPARYPLVFKVGGKTHALDQTGNLTACGQDWNNRPTPWRRIPDGEPTCGVCLSMIEEGLSPAVLPSSPEQENA